MRLACQLAWLGVAVWLSIAFPAISAAAGVTVHLPLVMRDYGAPFLGGCPMFPADNVWNRDVSGDPVDSNSDNFITYILNASSTDTDKLHADFGSNPSYGIPYVVVPGNQAKVLVTFDPEAASESDPGPYPIPPNPPIEAGSDHHILMLNSGECRLYELYAAAYSGSAWSAYSGAIFDLRSNANPPRPLYWTSADAAGLPILPGLARYDEAQAGSIRHALRVTFSQTQKAFVLPATHYASSITNPDAPPMGLRLRLKASYVISGFTGHARVILEALKRYGLIVADNGSNWFISGATDPRWNDTDLDQLKTVPGSAFEVIRIQPGTIFYPPP